MARQSRRSLILLVVAATIVASLSSVALAASKYTIVVGRGVGDARLAKSLSYNVSKLGKPSAGYTNRQYENPFGKGRRVVYVRFWGKKIGTDRYPLCMYVLKTSSGSQTFQFTAYGSAYKTSKGIKVGSSASSLKAAYPGIRRLSGGSTYTSYVLGKSPSTLFTVKSGKVFSITVRR